MTVHWLQPVPLYAHRASATATTACQVTQNRVVTRHLVPSERPSPHSPVYSQCCRSTSAGTTAARKQSAGYGFSTRAQSPPTNDVCIRSNSQFCGNISLATIYNMSIYARAQAAVYTTSCIINSSVTTPCWVILKIFTVINNNLCSPVISTRFQIPHTDMMSCWFICYNNNSPITTMFSLYHFVLIP